VVGVEERPAVDDDEVRRLPVGEHGPQVSRSRSPLGNATRSPLVRGITRGVSRLLRWQCFESWSCERDAAEGPPASHGRARSGGVSSRCPLEGDVR
jgi:hypothetical protein